MSLRKTFSSLRKLRLGGVSPQNRLGYPVHKIPIPTENTINQGKLFVVKAQSLSEKERKEDVKSCFFLATNINESGLEDTPSLAIDVEMADYNGTVIYLPGDGPLQICVARDEKHVFFKTANALIDKMVMPENSLKTVYFADNYAGAVLVFLKNFGYIYVSFTQTGRAMYRFFKDRHDLSISKVSSQEMEEKHQQELRKYEYSQRDPITVVRPEELSDETEILLMSNGDSASDDILRSGLPSLSQIKIRKPPTRQTRSVSRQTDEPNLFSPLRINSGLLIGDNPTPSGSEELATVEDSMSIAREIPELFDPPLYYSVDTDKKFVITYNDFKTLYNNDWINDTLIDFFIAFEMHKAVNELRLVQKTDVFAFNSFFFTKLFANSNSLEIPPYYENIRRWLAKVDFMSYRSVIIPVNEHLHWYFIIIKNLPKLLEHAMSMKQEDGENMGETEEKNLATKIIVEIYVIDSLRQSHANLGPPLREVIKQYCKEKHKVDISTDSIRLRNARVSKQRNFNDCGIHVIYNIQKWLGSPSACELIWKTHGKPKSQVFKTSEREAMRRKCINLLLDLHSKQSPNDPQKKKARMDSIHSDDDIELISCLSSYINHQEEKTETGIGTPIQETTDLSASAPPSSGATSSTLENSENPEIQEVPFTRVENAVSPTNEVVISAVSSGGQALHSRADIGKNDKSGSVKKEISKEDTKTLTNIPSDSEPKTNAEDVIIKREEQKDIGTYHKTLDPRIFNDSDERSVQSSRRIENCKTFIGHPEIRRSLMGLDLDTSTIEFLNGIFKDHSQRFDEATRKKIVGWTGEYMLSRKTMRSTKTQALGDMIRDALKKLPEPMDMPFIIEDLDQSPRKTDIDVEDHNDSNEELNKSVGDLSISKTKIVDKPEEARPGDTKIRNSSHLSKEEEADANKQVFNKPHIMSHSSNGNMTRHTRSHAKRSSQIADSDLEIMDDDLQLVSEISLIFSSPNTKQERNIMSSPRDNNSPKRAPYVRKEIEVTQISEKNDHQKLHLSPGVPGPRNSKALWPQLDSVRSIASNAPRNGSRELKSTMLPENIQVPEVVEVTEADGERQSLMRFSPQLQSKTTKRRRVDTLDRRAQGLREQPR